MRNRLPIFLALVLCISGEASLRRCAISIAYSSAYYVGSWVAPVYTTNHLLARHFPEGVEQFLRTDPQRVDLGRRNLRNLELTRLAPYLREARILSVRDNPALSAAAVANALAGNEALEQLDLVRTSNSRRIFGSSYPLTRIKKLYLGGVHKPDFEVLATLKKLSYLDMHASRVSRFSFLQSTLSVGGLRHFLSIPPEGLRRIALPNLPTEWMLELERAARKAEIELGVIPIYDRILLPELDDDLAYDGDTIWIHLRNTRALEGWWKKLRIKGIDAGELNKAQCTVFEEAMAIAARQYVIERLKQREGIEIFDIEIEKWGRLMAHVMIDGVRLSDDMLRLGLVRAYNGESRDDIDWRPYYEKVDKAMMLRLLQADSKNGTKVLSALRAQNLI